MPSMADELVRLLVDVLVVSGTAPVQAAKQASNSIPIVMSGLASDPIANGFVAAWTGPACPVLAEIDGLGVPAIYSNPQWVDAGGLMSCREGVADQVRRAAAFLDKLLRGARSADLPTQFPFVVHTKTAEAQDVVLPPTVGG